jgi:hypothetical protein
MLNVYNYHDNAKDLPLYNKLAHTIDIAFELFKSPGGWGRDPRIDYTNVLKSVESIIAKKPELAYSYASNILHRQWSAGEPAIMKSPEYAYYYARFILNRRWEDAESVIMKEPQWAYLYAVYVMKGRWKEAEPYIIKNIEFAMQYAMNTNERWPEAENEMHKILADEDYYNDETGFEHKEAVELWDEYTEHFGIDE